MRDSQTSPARSRGTFNEVHRDEQGAYLMTPSGVVFLWPPRMCPGCEVLRGMMQNIKGKTECIDCHAKAEGA
jgi:hypothetical protein